MQETPKFGPHAVFVRLSDPPLLDTCGCLAFVDIDHPEGGIFPRSGPKSFAASLGAVPTSVQAEAYH